MTNYLFCVKNTKHSASGEFLYLWSPLDFVAKERHLVAICLKWNGFPSLKIEKYKMMKHNPNVIKLCITDCVSCTLYRFLLWIFTEMLLVIFTRTYGLTRKEINRVWSILKTAVTGKRWNMDHAVKGRDITFTFRLMSRDTKAMECKKIYLLTPARKIYPSSVLIWVVLRLFSSYQLFSSSQAIQT